MYKTFCHFLIETFGSRHFFVYFSKLPTRFGSGRKATFFFFLYEKIQSRTFFSLSLSLSLSRVVIFYVSHVKSVALEIRLDLRHSLSSFYIDRYMI